MGIVTLLFGLLLPWLGGTLWLIVAESRLNRHSAPNRLRQAGYGFFLGYAVLFLAIIAADSWSGAVSWPWLIAFLLIFAGYGGLAALRTRETAQQSRAPQPSGSATGAWERLGAAQKLLVAGLMIWMAAHLAFAALEVLTQPVYPWDAWLAWVYRAKAWFFAGGLVDIVSPSQWAAAESARVYTIDAWMYPRLPSIIPYWAALSLGYWSETLVNLPLLFAGAAIGMALYGQCREQGLGMPVSLAICYLLFSIPLFGTHLALAGYADIWMAGFAGLGFIALMRGAITGSRFQTALGFLMILLCLLVKNEGAVWLLAVLLMQALVTGRLRVHFKTALVLAGAVTIAWALGITHIEFPLIGSLGVAGGRLEIPFIGSFALEAHNVWRVYWDNLFALGSWNLVWLLVVAGLIFSLQFPFRPSAHPERRVGLTFIIIFLATQVFIFGFTDQGVWADTYTAINRLPLHFIPALIFAAAAVLQGRLVPTGDVTATGAPANAGTGLIPARVAVTALLSAAIVSAGALARLAQDLPETGGKPLVFPAADFNFVMGTGNPDGSRLIIDGYNDGYALLSSGPVSIQAETLKRLEYDWEPLCSQKPPSFFWRRADDAANLAQIRLREIGRQSIDLSAEPGWQGEISEIGFLFEDDAGEAVTLGPAKLRTDGLSNRLRRTWDAWTSFERWSQRSINFLHGGNVNQELRLPVLAIAWLAIALLLLWIDAIFSGKPAFRLTLAGGLVLFLLAWMLLDVRWTANNIRQMRNSIETNWQADEHQRLLHGMDCSVYPWIQRIRDEVLSDRPARILIVSGPDVMDYYLQRAKYHLPPHSAQVSRGLSAMTPDSLDYVIFLGPAGGIRQIPGWGPKWQQALKKIDSGDRGLVYRVTKRAD